MPKPKRYRRLRGSSAYYPFGARTELRHRHRRNARLLQLMGLLIFCLAGALLQTVCREMQALGEPTLYLLTEHTRFYERYGWQYLCMVQADGDPAPCRVYVHTEN